MPSPWLRRELRSLRAVEEDKTHYRVNSGIERNACGKGLRWTATNCPSKVDCEECLERMTEQGIAF